MTPVATVIAPGTLANSARDLRLKVLEMAHRAHSGHIGSAFSVIDILATLYGGFLRIDPAHPQAPDRDRCILSKGHAASALYAVLAAKGFFPEEELRHYLRDGGRLPAHPSPSLPGVEVATGSLGHGLSIGVGMALAGKIAGKTYRTVVIVSDGECDEGSTWEAALSAAHHGLGNLLCIIDANAIQALGRTEDVLALEPLAEKWAAFGWSTQEVDGHDVEALSAALARCDVTSARPHVIVARTVKGKGVSFMQHSIDWHYLPPDDERYALARSELSAS